MKPLFCALLLVASFAASDSVSGQDTAKAGRVLMLDGDRAMEGDIEKVGEQYRVRRGSGEVWLPAHKAVRLCTDWEEAYGYMKSRANLGDPDERLRLARWCQLYNLRSQGLSEAKAALEMRPGHEVSRQLVTMLERPVAGPGAAAKDAAPAKETLPPAADVAAESYALFSSRVQPILMNACFNCHSGGKGGNFQLVRAEGNQSGGTRTNVAAVLQQIRFENPVVSPLLVKAVSRHGNSATAPIKDRQAIPFRNLQAWMEHLLANNPHLSQVSKTVPSVGEKSPEKIKLAQDQAKTAAGRGAAANSNSDDPPPPLPSLPDAQPLFASEGASTAPPRRVQSDSLDPFDPEVFNRQMHPRK